MSDEQKLFLGQFPPKIELTSINNLGSHCVSHLEDSEGLLICLNRLELVRERRRYPKGILNETSAEEIYLCQVYFPKMAVQCLPPPVCFCTMT